MKKQTIKMIANNPITRRMEEVYPESEVSVNEMSPRFWCESDQMWVSVPDVSATEVYGEWVKQLK